MRVVLPKIAVTGVSVNRLHRKLGLSCKAVMHTSARLQSTLDANINLVCCLSSKRLVAKASLFCLVLLFLIVVFVDICAHQFRKCSY